MISDCRKVFGMTVSRLFRSCSIKSITMYTLLVSEQSLIPRNWHEDSLGQGFANHHLSNVHNVFVSASHEGIYLPQSGDGEPMLFFLKFQLLERDDIPSLRVASTKDDSVRALLDLVQPLVREHRTSWKNRRVMRPRWNAHAVELIRGWWRSWFGSLGGLGRGRRGFAL